MNPDLVTKFRQSPRFRKWTLTSILAFGLYLSTGFLILPPILKWQLLKKLPPATHRVVTIRQVKFNPLAFSLTVRGLSLTETNGTPLASFDEFYANFQLSSIIRRAWTFAEISLKGPRLELIIDKAGHINLAQPEEPPGPVAPTNPPTPLVLPPILVFNLSVTNGHFGFADLSRKTPFHSAHDNISFGLKDFSTKPGQQSPYSLAAVSDTEQELAWNGTITAEPLGSTGAFRIKGLRLPKHSPYLEDLIRAQLSEGTLDVSGDYRLGLPTNGLDLAFSNIAIEMKQLRFKDPDTGDVVLDLPAYELRDGSFDWRARRVHVGSLLVNEPAAVVRRLKDGSINLPSLVLRRMTSPAPQNPATPKTSPKPEEPEWVFDLADYQLRNGSVTLEDVTVPGLFRSAIKPLSIRIQHFSTSTNSEAQLQLELATDSQETLKLESTYSMKPVRATGKFQINRADLKRYEPYWLPFFLGRLDSGRADLSLEFAADLHADTPQVVITNAALGFSDLLVNSLDGNESVAKIPQLVVTNASFDLDKKLVLIGAINSADAAFNARRESDGTVNLLSLLPKPAAAATNATVAISTNSSSSAPSDVWHAQLGEAVLGNWAFHFEDRKTRKPAKIDIDKFSLAVRGLEFPSNAPVTTDLSTRLNGSGTVAWHGKAWPYSSALVSDFELNAIDLRAFQPWLQEQLRMGIESGLISTKGRWSFNSPQSTSWLHVDGDLTISNFAAIDLVRFKEFVGWNEVAIRGIDLDLRPNQLAVKTVTLAGLRSRLVRGPDKQLNVRTVFPSSGTNAPDHPPAQAPSPPENTNSFPVRLAELKLDGASLSFSDESVQPPCVLALKQLDGVVTGLSTSPGSPATVALSGQTDEAAPFGLHGQISSPGPDLALELAFTNHSLQLTSFDPYMQKFAGHPLNKGRLSLDLKYNIHDRLLKAQNKVEIDQLTLGPRNDNPQAAKLPIKLAVALLKDNEGRINLDLPIEGRLDDPQFKVGPVLLKVVVNLIAKAAASPFKILGALVGGGEELSVIEFQPGTAALSRTQTNKLDKLVQALAHRPGLSLEIEGSVDPKDDRDALAVGIVRKQMKAQRLQELAASGQTPPAAQTFQLPTSDYERLLRAAVVKTWGTNLNEAVRQLARASSNNAANTQDTSNHPHQKLGVVGTVGLLFKPASDRTKAKETHRAAKADALLLKQNPTLGSLTADDMEAILTLKVEVPKSRMRQLSEDRAKAVQAYLMSSGNLPADRLFLVVPKASEDFRSGQAQVNLSLN
jgi:hypothetical protein